MDLKRLGITGLIVAATFLGIDKCSSVMNRPKEGKLASGMGYTYKVTSHETPYKRNSKVVIQFADGIIVEDAFIDGWIGPYDVTDALGDRVLSDISRKGVESAARIRLDNALRKDVLQRTQEVYGQQHRSIKVYEGN